jgi:hypothetical protein
VWVAKDHYAVEGMELSVRSTDESFLELVRGYLGPFRIEEGSDDEASFQVDCGTPQTLPGGKVMRPTANMYLGRLRIFCGPRWEEMAGRLIGGIRDLVTTHQDEVIRIRAAGGVVGGKAVILPSGPNPHLSALAGALTRAGAPLLGDELVKLDPILRRVSGLSLPILVDVSDLDLFPELHARSRRAPPGDDDERIDSRTPRHPVPVEALGGEHATGPVDLGWIVFPVFAPGEETRFEPVTKAEALFRLMEAVLNGHVWGERALILAKELVEMVPVSRIVVGSVEDAAELLTGLAAEVRG